MRIRPFMASATHLSNSDFCGRITLPQAASRQPQAEIASRHPRQLGARELAEVQLRLVGLGLRRALHALVPTVAAQEVRFDVVVQERRQDFVRDARAQGRVLDREDHLDAAVKISAHPVGAAEINHRLAHVAKIVAGGEQRRRMPGEFLKRA